MELPLRLKKANAALERKAVEQKVLLAANQGEALRKAALLKVILQRVIPQKEVLQKEALRREALLNRREGVLLRAALPSLGMEPKVPRRVLQKDGLVPKAPQKGGLVRKVLPKVQRAEVKIFLGQVLVRKDLLRFLTIKERRGLLHSLTKKE